MAKKTTSISKNGTITNKVMRDGKTYLQVKTKDGKYYEKKVPTVTRAKGFEATVSKSIGNPMDRAYDYVEGLRTNGEDPQDNLRHATAGRYTAEGLLKNAREGYIPFPDAVNKATSWLTANALGVGHELSTIFQDERPWRVKLREAGEDIYNNGVGVNQGLSDKSNKDKTQNLKDISLNYELPDGYGEEHPFHNKWQDPYDTQQFKNGGMVHNEQDLIKQYPHHYAIYQQQMAMGGEIPQYGFGEWLGKNAGIIGTVVGGTAGFFVGGPAGVMAGAKLGGMAGGALQKGYEHKQEMKKQQELIDAEKAKTNSAQQQVPATPEVPVEEPKRIEAMNTMFALGGKLGMHSPMCGCMACGGKIKQHEMGAYLSQYGDGTRLTAGAGSRGVEVKYQSAPNEDDYRTHVAFNAPLTPEQKYALTVGGSTGLGSVTEKEGKRLENMYGVLDIGGDKVTLKNDIKRLKQTAFDYIHGSKSEREEALAKGDITKDQNDQVEKMYREQILGVKEDAKQQNPFQPSQLDSEVDSFLNQ